MSLRVWLPLDGNLNNQGCDKMSSVNVPVCATVDTSGKIGKCYTSTGANNGVTTDFEFDAASFSIAAWVRINTRVNSWRCPFKLINSSAAADYAYIGFGCEHNTDATLVGFHFYHMVDGTNTSVFDAYPTTCTVGEWTHFAIAYDGVTVSYYKNGVRVQQATLPAAKQHSVAHMKKLIMFGTDGGRGASTTKTSLNDVRIYDHCLSAAEVKEIAQGLVLHYKLDNNGLGGKNLLRNSNFIVEATKDVPASGVPSSMPFTEDLQQLVGKTFTLSYEVYTPGARKNGVNGGSLNNRFGCHLTLKYTPSGGSQTTVYPCAAHLTTTVNERNQRLVQTYTVPSNCTINSFGISVQPYAQPADDNDAVWRLGKIKLEYGNKATSYSPALEDYGWPNDIIEDSSGYGHHGSTLNEVEITSDTARYESCTHLVAGNSMINCGRGGMVADSITVNIWIKASGWNNPVSCTEGGGWNFEANKGHFRFPVYIQGVGYKYLNATHTTTQVVDNQWHMLTGVYDRLGQKIHVYVDGEIDSTADTGSSNPIAYHASNVVWIGGEATGSATAGSNGMAGYFSDFRIYATALSADDILELYHTSAKIDNLGGIHAFEATENDHNKVTKTGLLESANICEIDGLSYLKYDPNVYIEPDGSAWVRIYHHNNPGAGSFSGSNDFAHSVYLDENRWFNVEVCDHIDKWEFMVKGRFTKNGDDWKIRWIQTVNPMTAAYADVAAANVTKITSNGYDAYKSYWGGLYAKKGSAYLTTNNGNSGNWWGAVGSYSVYQSGIPGWGPSDTVTTTGFNDLYVRIDNLGNDSPTQAKTTKNNLWVGHSFIEK